MNAKIENISFAMALGLFVLFACSTQTRNKLQVNSKEEKKG